MKYEIKYIGDINYQLYSVGCPYCGSDIRYSSGWNRDICEMCNYIDGYIGYKKYPDACSLEEWLFLVGTWYEQVRSRDLSPTDFHSAVESITFYGEYNRPPGEHRR